MTIAFCVLVLLCLINVSIVSSLRTPYSCAEYQIAPMQGFDKELYLGDWYIKQMYDFEATDEFPSSYGYNCFLIMRTPRTDGNQDFSEIIVKAGDLPEVRANGVTYFNHPGEGAYTFLSDGSLSDYNGEYIILDTDYSTYTIETKCTDLSEGGSEVELYVMSRSPFIPYFKQKIITKIIMDHHLDRNEIRTLNILSCPAEVRGSDGLLAGLLKYVLRLVGGLLGGVTAILG